MFITYLLLLYFPMRNVAIKTSKKLNLFKAILIPQNSADFWSELPKKT